MRWACVSDTKRAPTLSIDNYNGTRVHWRADMCEIAELPEAVLDRLWHGRVPKK